MCYEVTIGYNPRRALPVGMPRDAAAAAAGKVNYETEKQAYHN
jgi:hypothetical protein